ncbi:MAG: DUF58 domain-containing protein [Planctomycetaceae bacterium]|jgi:uncharacterized protein (DUF58 family)|nr:DUF58 domain-containing protein [Planctomycetaceae bacterium]
MFDSDFLKKLEYLSLVSRRVFRGQLLAQKRTKKLGSGVEFADHRDYAFGDDLRYLDWNVYARLGNRLIKRFEEEEDLHIYFFLDCSQSMSAGNADGLTKFDYARQITAALAYIALSDLDRVSVFPFADKIYDCFPLTRGKQHILSLLRFLEPLQTAGTTTDLSGCVKEFLHRKQHTGLAIIVSDLFAPAGFQKAVDTLRYQKFEPNLIQIHDAAEAVPDILGDRQLTDIETGAVRNVTISESVLRQYRQKFAAFLDSVRKYSIGNGNGCTITSTSVPFDEMVLRMMREAGGVK